MNIHQIINTKKKILFVGIGNVLRSDDGAGVYICQNINETERIKTLIVEVSIENYIQKINSIQPGYLILVDVVDFKQPPGYFAFVKVNDLQRQGTHTHNLSLHHVCEFFTMPVYVLGIQPERLDFGEGLTVKVKEAALSIADQINEEPVMLIQLKSNIRPI